MITINGKTFSIPTGSIVSFDEDTNTLSIDGINYVISNNVTYENGILEVNSEIVNISEISLDGNTLTINNQDFLLPVVSLVGSLLTVNNENIEIPSVTYDGTVLTVNNQEVTIVGGGGNMSYFSDTNLFTIASENGGVASDLQNHTELFKLTSGFIV